MGGAGGAIGANYLGQVAAPDGLTLGYFTGLATAASVAIPSIKVDVAKFEFVSGGPGISVAYARSDLGGGIRKPEDLLQKKDFWVGGLALDSDKDIRIRLQLDLLGLPYKYITGYPGSADIRLALMRNEVQLNVESMPAYRASVEPDLIKSGQAIPLWYDINDEANAQKSQETAGIDALPFGLFYKKVKGEDPGASNGTRMTASTRSARISSASSSCRRDSPKPAVDALRKALSELNDDKKFHRRRSPRSNSCRITLPTRKQKNSFTMASTPIRSSGLSCCNISRKVGRSTAPIERRLNQATFTPAGAFAAGVRDEENSVGVRSAGREREDKMSNCRRISTRLDFSCVIIAAMAGLSIASARQKISTRASRSVSSWGPTPAEAMTPMRVCSPSIGRNIFPGTPRSWSRTCRAPAASRP